MPVVGIDRSCANPDQDLIICRNWLLDVVDLQIRQAVLAISYRFHRICRRSYILPIAIVRRSPVSDLEPDKQSDEKQTKCPFQKAFHISNPRFWSLFSYLNL